MTTLHTPVLLLASRDQQLVYLIQRYADNCGCRLLPAETDDSILNVIEQSRPNVILLDMSQANAEGRQALRDIKSAESTRLIPVILCGTSETDWLDCEAEGRLLQPILLNDFAHVLSETGLQTPKNVKEA
jgi:CheY-like chemotaxis protein